MTTQTYTVSGMTCDHCVHAVTQEVSALAGVQGVSIDLVAGGNSTVVVESEAPLDVEAVREAVDEAGYELVS
ncbi:MAG: heavy metal transporter [Actinomycetales bacterium]|nr:heavy metal transporter [Actinomycetales bacterium]